MHTITPSVTPMALSDADRARAYRRRRGTGMIIVTIRIAPDELQAIREKGYEDEDLATAIETFLSDHLG